MSEQISVVFREGSLADRSALTNLLMMADLIDPVAGGPLETLHIKNSPVYLNLFCGKLQSHVMPGEREEASRLRLVGEGFAGYAVLEFIFDEAGKGSDAAKKLLFFVRDQTHGMMWKPEDDALVPIDDKSLWWICASGVPPVVSIICGLVGIAIIATIVYFLFR